MAAYLITWNPERGPWEDLAEEVERVRRGKRLPFQWSTGNTRRIVPGDRLYLLKQGLGERGIMGVGTATSKVFEDGHYDRGRYRAGDTALYLRGKWESLINPYEEKILPIEILKARIPEIHWAPPASGFPISEDAARKIDVLWGKQRHRKERTLYPDEAVTPELIEGLTRQVVVNIHERNPIAREACIDRGRDFGLLDAVERLNSYSSMGGKSLLREADGLPPTDDLARDPGAARPHGRN